MNQATHPHSPRTALAALWTASLVAALLLAAASGWPAMTLGGPDGVTAMGVGIGVCAVISLIAAVPPSLKVADGRRELATAILLGLGARFLLTLAAVAAVLVVAPGNKALLAWIGVGHVVLLAVDTAALISVMKPSFLRKEPV